MTLLSPTLTLFSLGAKFGMEVGYIDGSTLGLCAENLTNTRVATENCCADFWLRLLY